MLRALRLDKLTLAALEATLQLHCDGLGSRVPALRKLEQNQAALHDRAERLAGILGAAARIEATQGFAGGGTLSDIGIPSLGVSLSGPLQPLAMRLRGSPLAVIARIANGRVLLDVLMVDDADVPELAAAVQEALAHDT